MRLIARTMRVAPTTRLLRVGVLTSVLPTLLLTPLRAEVILLHSHCDGETHVHRLDAANLRDWQVRRAPETRCCDSGAAERANATVGAPDARCDHGQPAIVIAIGPFQATRAWHVAAAQVAAKILPSATPAVASADPRIGQKTSGSRSPAPHLAHARRDATATLLSRNHALLL